MKEINRSFAMRMLERKLGKPEKQILEEAEEESPEWPMGKSEFEHSLRGHESFAKAVIEHFGGKRPEKITRKDVKNLINPSGKRIIILTNPEVEGYRKDINLVFDLYDEK